MYYAIKIWDKNNRFLNEETTSIIEELPGIFASLDTQYPEADGYQLRALYVPETCYSIEREEFREAAATANADTMQAVFDSTDEEML